MDWFDVVCYIAIAVFTLAIVIGLTLAVRSHDPGTRVIMADLVFYAMLGVYFTWTLTHPVSIKYDIAIMASILGILSTVSLTRVLSKGRR